jgi:hypothetical protein
MLDDGVLELDINGRGLLRFNPSDFNLYERFCRLAKELPEIEKQYVAEVEEQSEADGLELAGRELTRAKEIDADIKRRLSDVFGKENDFDQLMGGVNLMAFGRNGERVITNLLNAITPYLTDGINSHMQGAAAKAVAEAKAERAMRGGE